MLTKTYHFLLTFMMLAIILFSCSKEKKSLQQEEQSGSSVTEQQKFEVSTNYDSLMIVVADLTTKIMADPSNISLRKALVSVCYDSNIDMIIAPGRGNPVQNAQTPSIAKEFALRAAKIEAYRWAYAIKQWHQDPAQPMPEMLNVKIPPARIVAQKTLPDNSVQILVVLSAQ